MAITLTEYEKLVFSTVFLNATASSIIPRQICSELTADKFGIKEHSILWGAVRNVVQRGELPHVGAIVTELSLKDLEKVGGEPYIRSLEGFLNTMGIKEVGKEHIAWVRLVDVAGRCRALSSVIKQYAQKLEDLERFVVGLGDDSLEGFLTRFLGDIKESGTFGKKSSYHHISTLYDNELRKLSDEMSGIPRDCVIVGWPQFQKFGIPRYGVLNVLAGLTGCGKTTLAATIGVGAAMNYYVSSTAGHVAYNCLEDSKEELYRRLGCAVAGVNSQGFKRATASIDDIRAYDLSLQTLNNLPIWIDDTPGITSTEMMLEAEILVMSRGTGPRKMGISDYSELFGDEGRDENLRLSAMARGLHSYARETGSSELLLTQYPELYNPEQIGGMRSKQARAIGQACKVYMELWNLKELRENSYAHQNFDITSSTIPDWSNPEYAYVLVHKNSGGEKGYIPLSWNAQYTRFQDISIGSDLLYDLFKEEG